MADRLTPTHFTVRLIELRTHASLAAAHERNPQSTRQLVIVAAHHDDTEFVSGWGECSALNTAGYTNEWAEGAWETLSNGLAFEHCEQPMAAAALEMAILDSELRRDGQSLSDQLHTAGKRSTAGAVVGIDTIPAMLTEVADLAAQGFGRVKCKIVPGRVVEPVRAIRERFPSIELHVDANASLTADDLGMLATLRDLDVRAVEQPFAVDDHQSAQRLVADNDMQVIADEAIATLDDVERVARDQSATAVALKPPRLGGIATTLQALDAVRAAGLGATMGGMLESGLGRHLLAALAPLDGFSLTGDLSPARRWLAEDPFVDIEMVDGEILAPSQPGIAGDPDPELLDSCTIKRVTVAAAPLLTSCSE